MLLTTERSCAATNHIQHTQNPLPFDPAGLNQNIHIGGSSRYTQRSTQQLAHRGGGGRQGTARVRVAESWVGWRVLPCYVGTTRGE
jgi:hypothetical protein